jgi:hypothetical protein
MNFTSDEEYLNEMAEQTIYANVLHLKNLEKQNKYLPSINFIYKFVSYMS